VFFSRTLTIFVFLRGVFLSAKILPIQDAAPGHLSAEAKRLWRDVQKDFAVSDAAGLQLLMRMCEALDGLRACQTAIREEGMTTKGSRSQIRPHPLLRVEAEYNRAFLAAARALNLDLSPE